MELYRTIDANINRLREGLRVIEDILRYQYNAAGLLPRVKQLRHSVADVDKATFRGRISYRDSLNDEGYDNTGANETTRNDAPDLLRANFLRCQEASRVLEEMLKIKKYEKRLYEKIKEIRYALYALEKDVFLQFGDNFNKDIYLNLNMIIDLSIENIDFLKTVKNAISGGITSLLIQGNLLTDKEFYRRADNIVDICNKESLPVIINSRADICVALNASGVHLNENDLTPELARNILGNNSIVGFSVKCPDDVKQMNNQNLDYLRYDIDFHRDEQINWNGIKEIIIDILEISILPVIFYMDVNLDNVDNLRKAGAYNLALKNSLIYAKDVTKAAKSFRK